MPTHTDSSESRDLLQLAFDENCLICFRFIQFLADRDPERRFLFAPLPPHAPQAALIVYHNGHTYLHSDAILILLKALGGHWRILAFLGLIIPRPLRDLPVFLLKKLRHRFVSKDGSPIPSQNVLQRIIPGFDDHVEITKPPNISAILSTVALLAILPLLLR